MKTILMALGLMVLTIGNAANNPSIIKEIEEKVKPNLDEFNFNQEHMDFVVVSFKVESQQVQVVEIMGSSDELIQIIGKELDMLCLDKIYPEDDVYNFKFIFDKQ
ncbi:MAG: hypothetical protein MK078_03740 [Crocinitomicaceae bacterium]|nr:hypothetical protein [Crocinitomicaceae bacterium]